MRPRPFLLFLSLLCAAAALAPQASASDSVFQLNTEDPNDGYAEVDAGQFQNMTVRIMNENDDPRDFELEVLNASDLNSEGVKVYWTYNGQEELSGNPTKIVVSVSDNSEVISIRLTIEANPNALYGSWPISLRAHDKDTTVDPDQQNRYLNLTIHVNETRGVTVSVTDSSSTDLSVDVDGEASYTLRVQNTGNRQDTFNLGVGGGDWDYTLDTEQVTLDPGANVMVGLTIETDSGVDYGDSETITISAISINPTNVGEMHSTVYIRVFEGVLLNPVTSEKSGEPGAMVTFDFTVTNKWSEEVIFTLEKKDWYMGTIENKPSNWDFTDASNDNTIEGFGTVTARARITIASDANANDVVTIIVKAYVGNGEPAETEIDVRVEGDYDLRFEPLEISEFDVNVGTEIFLSAFLELTNSAKVSDEVLLEAEWTTGGDDWDLNIAGGSSWKYFAAGETKKVYVSVKAPPDSEGDFTTLRITASSGGDGLEKDNVELHFRVAATSGGGGGSAASIDLISPSPAPEGSAIIFIGSGSDNGTAVAYLWESSIDGELSTEANFSSSDLSIGTHTITFRVQDNDGAWSDAAPASLFVGIAPIPKAGIDVKVEPNTEVQFTGSGTDEDGTIVNYEWDLNGDGVYDWSSTLNGITTHIYNGEGTYTAVLRLTDDDGFTATDSRVITVSKASDDAGDDDGFLPAPSLAAAVAAVAVIALHRPRKP